MASIVATAHRPYDGRKSTGQLTTMVSTVLGAEIELPDACQQLAFQFVGLQVAGHDAAVHHLAAGRDLQLQHHLALQRRVVAQRAVVQRMDRALVAVEDQLDVLDRARRPGGRTAAARPGCARAAGRGTACTGHAHAATTGPAAAAATGHAGHQRGGAPCQPAAAAVAAEGGAADAAAGGRGIRRHQRAQRQAGFVAGAHARPRPAAHAGAARRGLQLHGHRCTVDLRQLLLQRQQAHAGGGWLAVVAFTGGAPGLRPPRFGHHHRRPGRRHRLGRPGRCGRGRRAWRVGRDQQPRHRCRRQRQHALEHRPRQPGQHQREQQRRPQAAQRDAPPAAHVLGCHFERQPPVAERRPRHHRRGHAPSCRRTANDTSVSPAAAALRISERSQW
jgi:hypothetical protein